MKAKAAFFLFLEKSMYFLSIVIKCFPMIKIKANSILYVCILYIYIKKSGPSLLFFVSAFCSDIL